MSVVNRAPDDIQNSEKVRSLLKDIREARQAKSRDGLQKIDHSELSVRSVLVGLSSALTVTVSYRIYVPWKSTKSALSLCALWACSRTLLVILRPVHDNSRYNLPQP
jgi:hypothetical protein